MISAMVDNYVSVAKYEKSADLGCFGPEDREKGFDMRRRKGLVLAKE